MATVQTNLSESSSIPPKSSSGLLSFRNNPVAWAEFRHQRHLINTSRSGVVWIILASIMLIPAMLYGMVMYGAVLFGFTLPSVDQYTTFGQILGWLFIMLLTMNVALYGVVELITLALSSRSITREKTGGTWDTLVLTNIDSRRIVLGKWWASLRALWGDHLMILLLRLGLLGQVLLFVRENATALPFDLPIGVALVIPATLLIIAVTIVDAALTAAMGIAIPLSNAAAAVVGALALGIRVFASIALIMMGWDVAGRILSGGQWFLYGLIWLAGFCVATWIALRVAYWLAVLGEVSAPDHAE